MINLPKDIIDFFHAQGCVLVSTIDKAGFPHSSCKGLVKIGHQGEIYLMDVYHGRTSENLKRNPLISVSAFNEHKFVGYCLKGKAKVVPEGKISQEIIKSWEDKVTSRLTQRLLKNLHEEKGHLHHPEAKLPHPKYLILVKIEEIVNLAPVSV